MNLLDDPTRLGDLAPPGQDLHFLEDDQYFTWMEIYLSRFDAPRIARWLAAHRPIYNRSAGGHITLYFWDPHGRRQEAS
jgi:poly(beta-D-mannuronate) lyase